MVDFFGLILMQPDAGERLFHLSWNRGTIIAPRLQSTRMSRAMQLTLLNLNLIQCDFIRLRVWSNDGSIARK